MRFLSLLPWQLPARWWLALVFATAAPCLGCGGLVRWEDGDGSAAHDDRAESSSGPAGDSGVPGRVDEPASADTTTDETGSHQEEEGILDPCGCEIGEPHFIRVWDLRRNKLVLYDRAAPSRDINATCSTLLPHGVHGICDAFLVAACTSRGACVELAVDGKLMILTLNDLDEGDLSSLISTDSELTPVEPYLPFAYSAVLTDDQEPVYEVEFNVCPVNQPSTCR